MTVMISLPEAETAARRIVGAVLPSLDHRAVWDVTADLECESVFAAAALALEAGSMVGFDATPVLADMATVVDFLGDDPDASTIAEHLARASDRTLLAA